MPARADESQGPARAGWSLAMHGSLPHAPRSGADLLYPEGPGDQRQCDQDLGIHRYRQLLLRLCRDADLWQLFYQAKFVLPHKQDSTSSPCEGTRRCLRYFEQDCCRCENCLSSEGRFLRLFGQHKARTGSRSTAVQNRASSRAEANLMHHAAADRRTLLFAEQRPPRLPLPPCAVVFLYEVA